MDPVAPVVPAQVECLQEAVRDPAVLVDLVPAVCLQVAVRDPAVQDRVVQVVAQAVTREIFSETRYNNRNEKRKR